MELPLRNLRWNAVSNCIIRNICIHKTECTHHGILSNRHARHDDAVASYPATLLQLTGPVFSSIVEME